MKRGSKWVLASLVKGPEGELLDGDVALTRSYSVLPGEANSEWTRSLTRDIWRYVPGVLGWNIPWNSEERREGPEQS